MFASTGFWWILFSMGLYGLLHSILASLWFKRLVERLFGDYYQRFYRLFFVIFVMLTFLPVLALIFFLPDKQIYRIPFPWLGINILIQMASLWGLRLAFKRINIWTFVGVSQLPGQGEQEAKEPFVTESIYRYMRHPLYFFSLLIIWLMPVMTVNILSFNIAATLYIFVGSIFEEQKLIKEFGSSYKIYQRETSRIFPRKK